MNKLTVIFAAALSCLSLQVARHAANDFPKRLEAGSHRLRVRVEGEGSPTVVMEIGLGGPLEEWAAVQPEVAKFARVVTYDRIGAHYTDQILTGREIAADLHAALAKAQLPPPYVLVGQSFAGIYNRIFASMYPTEVAGMVLLDPAQEQFIEWMRIHHPDEEFSKKQHRNWPEARGVLPTLDELASGGPLPDVPVVVVTCARPSRDPLWTELLPVWKAMHDQWVQSLPHGRHMITEKSGHGIQVEQPDLVVDVIREVVEAVRHSDHQTASDRVSQRGAP
jgi:pimeloyl-ACP methyl ester carboxylesterase